MDTTRWFLLRNLFGCTREIENGQPGREPGDRSELVLFLCGLSRLVDLAALLCQQGRFPWLISLDPTYMLIYHPSLYDLWVDITRGGIEHPSSAILQDFGAHYVLTDLKHSGFLERAAQDLGLVEVYRDGEAVIYRAVSVDSH